MQKRTTCLFVLSFFQLSTFNLQLATHLVHTSYVVVAELGYLLVRPARILKTTGK